MAINARDTAAIAVLVVFVIMLGCAFVFLHGCNSIKPETVKVLDQTLTTLTAHGCNYELTVSGQTSAGVWQKLEFGGGTPGWMLATVKSPQINPLAGDFRPLSDATTNGA